MAFWKRRFRLFAKKLEFELEIVNMFVYVTVCLHNLICMEDRDNLYEDVDADAFVAYEDDDEDMRGQYEEMKEEFQSEPENLTAKVWRDNIAKKLWAQQAAPAQEGPSCAEEVDRAAQLHSTVQFCCSMYKTHGTVYSTKTLFQLPPITILYMPSDVMLSKSTN